MLCKISLQKRMLHCIRLFTTIYQYTTLLRAKCKKVILNRKQLFSSFLVALSIQFFLFLVNRFDYKKVTIFTSYHITYQSQSFKKENYIRKNILLSVLVCGFSKFKQFI